MLLQAPAKINLTLRILSKREDGYHEISSLMYAIRLFDEVEILSCAGGGEYSMKPPVLRVRSDMAGVPEGHGNLAYRAAELMLEKYPGRYRCIDITLRKKIPIASGLGGGSANAAAVLLGLAKDLAPDVKLPEVSALGATLGKDVPFCVYACAAANPALGYKGASAALAEGAGDLLTPVDAPEKARIVLVKPQIEVSAKQVYDIYDTWKGPDVVSDNDLEFHCARTWPVVAELLSALKKICASEGADGAKVQLSGSGPTIFVYFKDFQKAIAERVYARAKDSFHGMFVHMTKTL